MTGQFPKCPPPVWERVRVADCDGCGRREKVAPVGEVQLCLRCVLHAQWIEEDQHDEAIENAFAGNWP